MRYLLLAVNPKMLTADQQKIDCLGVKAAIFPDAPASTASDVLT